MKPLRVVVLAKAPQPGAAKTRLIPALGADGAARLAHRMLQETLAAALLARLGPVELCATPSFTDQAWKDFPLPAGVELSTQDDGDLGARMAAAARRTLARGETVLLAGADCAEMSTPLLQCAAAALREYDTFMQPSADGGYALLGLTRFDPRVFESIAWSTDSVAAATVERIRELDWSLRVGHVVHDVDRPEDLAFLETGWAP